MKLTVIRPAGPDPQNLDVIRELLIAIPDEGCATLDLIDGMPHLIVNRKVVDMPDHVSLALLPEWLSEPEYAGKLSIAAASFVASLLGTEKPDKPADA